MGAVPRKPRNLNCVGQPISEGIEFRGAVRERIEELKAMNALKWPRIKNDKEAVTIHQYQERYMNLQPKAHLEQEFATVRGRLRAFRIAGRGLVFLDIVQDDKSVQIVLNKKKLVTFGGVTRQSFEEFYHLVRRGDIMCELSTLQRPALILITYSCLWESIFL